MERDETKKVLEDWKLYQDYFKNTRVMGTGRNCFRTQLGLWIRSTVKSWIREKMEEQEHEEYGTPRGYDQERCVSLRSKGR